LFLKNFLTLSVTTYLFGITLWVLWYFVDHNVPFLLREGSWYYLPHAARVLCVVYFGCKAIPSLYLAELSGPYLFVPTMYSFDTYFSSLISVLSVPLAIQVLHLLSFRLGDTALKPLNKRNYKHIYLITFISAGFNAILVNLYLSRNELNFPGLITDIEQVSRFFVGDIIGTVIVFVSLSYILKPIIVQSRINNS
jgi:hypothetical protein